MKKSGKIVKNILIFALICIWVFFGYKTYTASKTRTTGSGASQPVTVTTGSISQTIKALGKTTIVNEQQIRFNQIGKVQTVNVKEGDSVKKGQIIAELDYTELKNTIAQNEISYNSSQASLNDLLNGNEASSITKALSDVSSAQHKVENAQDTLANLKTEAANKITSLQNSLAEQQVSLANAKQNEANVAANGNNQIDQAKKALDSSNGDYALAQKQLVDAKSQNVQTVSQTDSSHTQKVNTAVLDVKNGLIDASTILNDIDGILGITDQNKSKSASYSQFLSVKNVELKNLASNYFSDASSKKIALDSKFIAIKNKATKDISDSELVSVLNDTKTLFDVLVQLTDTTYQAVDNSVTSASFTESQMSALESTASARRSTAQSRLGSVTTDITNIQSADDVTLTQTKLDTELAQKQKSLDDIGIQKTKLEQTLADLQKSVAQKNSDAALATKKVENIIADAKNQITQTQATYDAQFAASERSIVELQSNVTVAQEQYNETKRGAKYEAIVKAKNDVAQKKLQLAQSKTNIDKYQIIAPFDGIIRSIDFKTGDNLVSDDTKYVYIQNPNLVQVSVLLDQTDIVKVRAGLPVTMDFYSYPNETFTGTISQVSGLPTTSSSVTSYEAKMILETKGKTFYSGMTQNVKIILAKKDNVLLVPSATITEKNKKKTVELFTLRGQAAESREVITGITDGTNTEIVSGLEAGDKVMKKTFSASSSTTTSSSSSTKTSTRSSGMGIGGGMPPM